MIRSNFYIFFYHDLEVSLGKISKYFTFKVNLIDLEDGGMLDDDSIPEWMQPLRDAGQQPIHLHQQSQPKTFTETSGFVRLPEGISPVLGGHNEGLPLSVPGAPPPGTILDLVMDFYSGVNKENFINCCVF